MKTYSIAAVVAALAVVVFTAACGGQQTINNSYSGVQTSTRVVPTNAFGKIVPLAPVFLDGVLQGHGATTVTYGRDQPHQITGGDVRPYSVIPDAVQIPAGDVVGKPEVQLVYGGSDLAETCWLPVDAETQAPFAVDYIEVNGEKILSPESDGSYCAVSEVSKPVRAIGAGTTSLIQPGLFTIPANILTPGASKSYTLLYMADGTWEYRCVMTTPVVGEIFVKNKSGATRSIGWQDGQPLCANVDKNNDQGFTFGAVSGVTTAQDVQFADQALLPYSNGFETAVGWYAKDRTNLLCVQTQDQYGNPLDAQFIQVDGVKMLLTSNQASCAAVDQKEHVVECGPAKYNANMVAPDPGTVPASKDIGVKLGNYKCDYKQVDSPVTTGSGRNVEVKFYNTFTKTDGSPYEQDAYFIVPGATSRNRDNTAYWSGDADAIGPEGLVINIFDEPYLNTPTFALSRDELKALTTTSGNYNKDRNLWVYSVVFTNTAPSMLACAQTMASGLVQPNPTAWFNTFEGTRLSGVGETCRVIPVGQDLIVSFGYYNDGYRTPSPITIPAGKYAKQIGEHVLFTGRFIPASSAAEVWIGTKGAEGEIFLGTGTSSTSSLGYSAWTDGKFDVHVVVDITDASTFSFSTESGKSVAPITFTANDPKNPDGLGTLGWNSTTFLFADYTAGKVIVTKP